MIQLTTPEGMILVRSDDIKAVEQVAKTSETSKEPRYRSRIYIPGHQVLVLEEFGAVAELLSMDSAANPQSRSILSVESTRFIREKVNGRWEQKPLY